MKRRYIGMLLIITMLFSLIPAVTIHADAAGKTNDDGYVSVGTGWKASDIAAWIKDGHEPKDSKGQLFYHAQDGEYYPVTADKDYYLTQVTRDRNRLPMTEFECYQSDTGANGSGNQSSWYYYYCVSPFYIKSGNSAVPLQYMHTDRGSYYRIVPYYSINGTTTYYDSRTYYSDDTYGWWYHTAATSGRTSYDKYDCNYLRLDRTDALYESSENKANNYNWVYYTTSDGEKIDLSYDQWGDSDVTVSEELFYRAAEPDESQNEQWVYTPVDKSAWLTDTDYESYGDLFYFDGSDYHQVSTTPAEHLYQNAGTSWTLTNAPGKYYSMSPTSFGVVRAGTGTLYKTVSGLEFRDFFADGEDHVKSRKDTYGIRSNYFYKFGENEFGRIYAQVNAFSSAIHFEGRLYYYNANDGQEPNPSSGEIGRVDEGAAAPTAWLNIVSKFTQIQKISGNSNYCTFIWGGSPAISGTFYEQTTGNNHLEYHSGSGTYVQLPNSSLKIEDGTDPTLYTGDLYSKDGSGAEYLYYMQHGERVDISTEANNGKHSLIKGDTIYTGPLYTRSIEKVGKVTGEKSLSDRQSDGTYTLTIDSWATEAYQGIKTKSEEEDPGQGGETEETVKKPLDITLIIDQSSSMATEDMGTKSYTPVTKDEWTVQDFNSGTTYYYKSGDNYYPVKMDTGSIYTKVNDKRGSQMFGYGHDGISLAVNGAPIYFNVPTDYYVMYNGAPHKIFMVTVGLDFHYGLYPYIYTGDVESEEYKTLTSTPQWIVNPGPYWVRIFNPWTVQKMRNKDNTWNSLTGNGGASNAKISFIDTNGNAIGATDDAGNSAKLSYSWITESSKIKNLYQINDSDYTKLYYVNDNGEKVSNFSSVRYLSTDNFTIEGNTLYTVSGGETRVQALKNAVNDFVKSVAENAAEDGEIGAVEHRIAIVGFAQNKIPANYSTSPVVGSNGKRDYANTGIYLNGEFLNYETLADTMSSAGGDHFANRHYYTDASGTDAVRYNYATGTWYHVYGQTGDINSGSLYDPTYSASLGSDQYSNAFEIVNENDTDQNGVNDDIDNAINSFGAYGGAYTSYGMAMANQIFANNTGKRNNSKGESVDPEKVIIVFTDGEPGANGYEDAIANEALASGVETKTAQNVKIYTVGLYPNSVSAETERFMKELSSEYTAQLTQVEGNTSNKASKTVLDGDSTYYYKDAKGKYYAIQALRNGESSLGWWEYDEANNTYRLLNVKGENAGSGEDVLYENGSEVYGEKADVNKTYLSENGYPVNYEYRWYDADRNIIVPWSSENTSGKTIYEITGQTRNSGEYYMSASDSDGLKAIFQNISETIMVSDESSSSGSSSSNTPTQSVVSYNADNSLIRDVISGDFKKTDGTTVTLQLVSATADTEGNITAGDVASAGEGYSYSWNGKTIDVIGYDFSSNYVNSSHPGTIMRVVITGLEPTTTGTVYSNTQSAGIYEKDFEGKVGDMIFQYNNPEKEIPTYTVTWMNDGVAIEVDTDVVWGEKPSYDGEEPTKEKTSSKVYTFKGWSETENGAVLEDFPKVTKNVTYYAVYDEADYHEYTVYWMKPDSDDKSEALQTDTKVETGAIPNYTGAVPVKTDSIFAGWSTDKDYVYDDNTAGTKMYFGNKTVEELNPNSSYEVFLYPIFVSQSEIKLVNKNLVWDFSANNLIDTEVNGYDVEQQNSGVFTWKKSTSVGGETKEDAFLFTPVDARDDSGNYDLTPMSGINSAYYYKEDTTTHVTIVPANNIYYDEELLETTVVASNGSHGYNGDVTTQHVETVKSGMDGTKEITFFGKRIDAYFTTDDTANSVTVTVKNSAGEIIAAKLNGNNATRLDVVGKRTGGALTNVPVVSAEFDAVGTYTLVLKSNNTFRLDGVRIYGTANESNDTIKEIYEANNESNAEYFKVRDLLIKAESFNSLSDDTTITGVVYTETKEDEEKGTIATYKKNGPKNEVYLEAEQGIAFTVLDNEGNPISGKKIMVGMSAPSGTSAQVQVSGGDNAYEYTISSNVDMYYLVEPNAEGHVFIKNVSGGMLAITNIKITDKVDAGDVVSPLSASIMLKSSPKLMRYVSMFNTLNVEEQSGNGDEELAVEEPAETPEPEITQDPTDDPVVEPTVTPTPTPEPTVTPTPTPTTQNSFINTVKTVISKLINRISKLFRW